MNILSISQLQTQSAQSDLGQVLPAKTNETEKSSFADYLRDARKTEESRENAKSEKTDENRPFESERLTKNEENADSDKVNEKKDEKNLSKDEKSGKLAHKKSSEDEKTEKNLSEESSGNEKFLAQSANIIQNDKIQKISDKNAEKIAINENASLSDNKEIDDKMLAWLVASTKDVENEEISNEDFAALIDAAVEFIPGTESEEEKLVSAQNLSANDPELFLNAVSSADTENLARGAVKSEFSLDDKKIVSSKEKKGESKISLHDLRTHRLFDESDSKIASDKIVQKAAEKKEINLSMQKQADGNIQMTMELAAKAEQNITSSSAQTAGANGSNFQAMLSNAVQENAPDFVKAGNIVLKDNNQGSINLILRPEGLGNVKISLNLDDKNLSAQIVVHTKEAMEAFKESIPSLKQAFTESGFETGSFDLNFSNNSSQQGFAQGENQNQQNAGILAHKTYGDFVTPSALANESAEAYSGGDYSVNIVA